MKKAFVNVVAASLILTAGCFSPDLSKGEYLCDGVATFCPEGLSCIDGRCRAGGDMSVSDGGIVQDLSGPTNDLSFTGSGCRSGGGINITSPKGSTNCFLCAGNFAPSPQTSRASELCAPGWSIPTSAASVDLAKCETIPGFFVAEVPQWWEDGISSGCGVTPGGYKLAGFGGCGMGQDMKKPVACNGFQFGRHVTGFPGSFTIAAPYTPLSTTTTNTRSNYGVICCR